LKETTIGDLPVKLDTKEKIMGKPELDQLIIKQSNAWGENYNSEAGCDHNSEADKIDSKVNGKDVTINIMSKMDSPHPKTDNPGVDKAFWAKANPTTDTVEGFKLTRSLKDKK
jgi:hypothetical protein